MTMKKQELIAQVIVLLRATIKVNESLQQIIVTEKKFQPIEMLKVKKRTEAIKGLTEHTIC